MESKTENPEVESNGGNPKVESNAKVESSPDKVKSKSAGSQEEESVGASPPGIEPISASARELEQISTRSV